MFGRTLTLAALIGNLPAAGYSDIHQNLQVGSTEDINLIVVCSEFPELNADRIEKFLTSRAVETSSVLIVDNPTELPEAKLGDRQLRKALLLATNRDPSHNVMDCVRGSVSFDQFVFDLSAETWATIGVRQDDPAHPLYSEYNKLAKYYAPTSSMIRFHYFPDENWTVAISARTPSPVDYTNNILELWFKLYSP